MPLSFATFMPPELDGSKALYTFADIEKVGNFLGLAVNYDQLVYAYQRLRKNETYHNVVAPIKEGNAYKFSSAGACLVLRYATIGQDAPSPTCYTLEELMSVNHELGFHPDPHEYARLLGYRRAASLSAQSLREGIALKHLQRTPEALCVQRHVALEENSATLRELCVECPVACLMRVAPFDPKQ